MSIQKAESFGTEKIWKILCRITPPIMLAQLILALYNIVDSYFIGKYSGDGLTALSVIFPIQLIITALAVGTGVGVNTYMARLYAQGKDREADRTAGTGMVLAVISWLIFTVIMLLIIKPFAYVSASSQTAAQYTEQYGIIISVGSIGVFLEGIWTKVHQAQGNMIIPMLAQIAGALVNIILDPLLIFGVGDVIPALGISGAAFATVIGQLTAAGITGIRGIRKPPAAREILTYSRIIYQMGIPSIVMQSLYTVYIMLLNMILAGFSDAAVTVLGLYYKLQTFFFIPLFGLQTSIVPVLSYNYTRKNYDRCKSVLYFSISVTCVFMLIGLFCFTVLPENLIGLFSVDPLVHEIGQTAFPIIGCSFIPVVFSLIPPVFFQAIGKTIPSVLLSVIRQIVCLVPIFWILSWFGLQYTWLAFPISEIIAGSLGMILYFRQIRQWKNNVSALHPMSFT